MTRLIGPYPFLFDGEPRLSAFKSEFNDRVRIVVYDKSCDAFNEISVSFECKDAIRIMRAVRAFNDEMQRSDDRAREAAE